MPPHTVLLGQRQNLQPQLLAKRLYLQAFQESKPLYVYLGTKDSSLAGLDPVFRVLKRRYGGESESASDVAISGVTADALLTP
ncbi:hypothetical protein KIPB_001913 [Kipferlia bialata]|uniref:Uncharacterized protein n=1 Tax=Kipferlia bialata TaxID=797122 RepID=A0A9K3CR07_9EUKA|nr:hypothetical protein KIPB_001913 [Kipferlia bialata]|eukprot:g1913.t1